jgi:hypothetical protein
MLVVQRAPVLTPRCESRLGKGLGAPSDLIGEISEIRFGDPRILGSKPTHEKIKALMYGRSEVVARKEELQHHTVRQAREVGGLRPPYLLMHGKSPSLQGLHFLASILSQV